MPRVTIEQAMSEALRHHQAGRLAEAEAEYRNVLAEHPAHADAIHSLGLIALQTGQVESALQLIRHAIDLNPSAPHYHCNLSQALQAIGHHDDAITTLQTALKLDPNSASAHYNLGNALRETGRISEAIAAFRRSLELRPESVNAWYNLGNVLQINDELDEAIASHQRAIQLQPDYKPAWNNLGLAFHAAGRFDQAIDAFQQALKFQPDWPIARFNLSMTLLLLARFDQGWPCHEARRNAPELVLGCRDFPKPMWDGSDLNGRRILIHSEQGIGDAIQFVRYLPLVAERGGKIILQCDPRLERLFRSLRNVDQIVTRDPSLNDFDVHVPLMSLPTVFQTTIQTIPVSIPYLSANPDLVRQWQSRLQPDNRLKVGLVWAGRAEHLNDRRRSMPLSALDPLGEVDGIHFISLQKDRRDAPSQSPSKLNLTNLTSDLKDLADTAALIENLDLVITVDTAVAHLAGAMGRNVWVMLPNVPDWRWLLDRSDSPWYPTMRLFRQRARGDWRQVAQDIAESLLQIRE